MSLSLDNCVHCACVTALPTHLDPAWTIAALDRGELGCWNCEDQQDDDEADGHTRCVQLMDDDGNVLWDGRCQKTMDSTARPGFMDDRHLAPSPGASALVASPPTFLEVMKAEDFVFTVEANGITYDVYRFTRNGKRGTLAYYGQTPSGPFVIAVCEAGELTEAQVRAKIAQAIS